MQTLEDVLELVTMAREHIECGLVDDARWMLELVEGDLADLARLDSPPHAGGSQALKDIYNGAEAYLQK